MQGIGLVVITIGINGAIQGENTLVLITSMVIGILIGESLDIHGKVNQIVHRFGVKLKRNSDKSQLTQGFLSATMLFCIGSMAVIGSLESGLTGNNITLSTKTAIDGVSSILLTSSLGVGVIFSSIPVLFYQGTLILFTNFLAPFLREVVILEMTTVGSVLLIDMDLNLLNITDIEMMNFIPAIFLPMIIMLFM